MAKNPKQDHDFLDSLANPEGYQDLNLPHTDSYHDHQPKNLWERICLVLANDIVAGSILIGAAVLALLCANGPFREGYQALANYHIGPEALGLHHSISHWAQDGILTLFFFTVGLELKQEFVTGSLHNVRIAALPIIAAIFGMIGPAIVYLTVTIISGDGAHHGWAIPTATDIAFAVAILQIFGRGLPLAARTFLLTLAVADDLGGILVIAIFYASGFNVLFLLGAFVGAAVFGVLTQTRRYHWLLLIIIGVLTWYCMLQSGVHATIAGVLLGMVVPAKKRANETGQMTERMAESVNPFSAGLAVPIFAFFAAGVNVVDIEGGATALLTNPVTLAVALAMPIGKFLGIFGSVFLFTRFTPLALGKGISLRDMAPVSLVAGIGFTVALLVSHLAFKGNVAWTDAGSFGVLLGTLMSVILGAIALSIRCKQLRVKTD